MKFIITREVLLKPLQTVSGAVERKQTLPIMSNVLLEVKSHLLTIVATDSEIEIQGRVTLNEPAESGVITVPARKLLDICRTLPAEAQLEVSYNEPHVTIKTARSRFTIASLPADEFPTIEMKPGSTEFSVPQKLLRHLIQATHFSMGQNDVRYYLNGLSFRTEPNQFRATATDGHRLATTYFISQAATSSSQVIVPRKGVAELLRLLTETDDELNISISTNHIRVAASDFIFTSKLIDTNYPDYNKVIPRGGDKIVIIDRDTLKNALVRVSILSNEKFRGVRIHLTQGRLVVAANNPEQEEAEEQLEVDYNSEDISIGFNVNYMLDVLSNVPSGEVRLTFKDSGSSLLIETLKNSQSLYVIMPMRL